MGVSQRQQAQPHQRQGQQCSGVMKLLIVSVLLVIVTLGDAAPLIFAAGIIKGSTIARGIYGLLGIQPENFLQQNPHLGNLENLENLRCQRLENLREPFSIISIINNVQIYDASLKMLKNAKNKINLTKI